MRERCFVRFPCELRVLLGCEVTNFILIRLKYDSTILTLVFDNDFGLWVLLLEMCLAFDVRVVHAWILTL